MPNLRKILHSMATHPRYTLMRAVARFGTARRLVEQGRRLAHANKSAAFLEECEARMPQSLFQQVDRGRLVLDLERDGVAFGLKLPKESVDEILRFTQAVPVYADRDVRRGYRHEEHSEAQVRLGKPILLAQYFNAAAECAAIEQLANDSALHWIACKYLGSVPKLVGVNMWWTYPVDASAEDRDLHAHLFHRDVDDFRFFKFFFYLTDVPAGEGAHICVVHSHQRPPVLRTGDRWNIRRYSDAEIASAYSDEHIVEICGEAGTGFAENTLCVHKGRTPTTQPRLLLQIQFALFDYGFMHDLRSGHELKALA